MLIADLFLRYRRHFRVAILALLLITPSQSWKAQNGCREVATALAKNPILDVLVKEPNFLSNAVKCLQETIRLIGETGWKTVQAVPAEIKQFIHNVGQHATKSPGEYATGAGLVFMSVYLFYKATELKIEARHLAQEHKRFQEEFDLLEEELTEIKSFTDEVVRQLETGNTAPLKKNIEKVFKHLDRSSTILKELINQIHDNAKKCESGKAWCVFYGVLATGACVCAICTRNVWVYATVCGVSLGTIVFSVATYKTNNKTLQKSDSLRQKVNDWRKKIRKSRINLEMKL